MAAYQGNLARPFYRLGYLSLFLDPRNVHGKELAVKVLGVEFRRKAHRCRWKEGASSLQFNVREVEVVF